MKAGQISSTAVLIARALLLAEKTSALQPLLIGDSAALTRRLLGFTKAARWFDLMLSQRTVRAFLFAIERATLPGIIAHWLARKCWIDALAHEAIGAGCRQLVVLGAGLDTLALRFRNAAVCFELDHSGTQQIKRAIFPDGAALVPLDLLCDSPAAALRTQPNFGVFRRPESRPGLWRGSCGESICSSAVSKGGDHIQTAEDNSPQALVRAKRRQ